MLKWKDAVYLRLSSDDGYTGTDFNRLAFQEMLKDKGFIKIRKKLH